MWQKFKKEYSDRLLQDHKLKIYDIEWSSNSSIENDEKLLTLEITGFPCLVLFKNTKHIKKTPTDMTDVMVYNHVDELLKKN
jgi:hypothetical protein